MNWRGGRTLRNVLGTGLLALVCCGGASAHKGSDAYVDVQQQADATTSDGTPLRSVRFLLSLAIKDLDLLLPMDANADGRVTWGEIRAAMPEVLAVAHQGARLDARGDPSPACSLRWQFDGVEQRSDGAYVRLAAQAACPFAQPLALRYTLLADQDTNHRLLVAGQWGGKEVLTTTSPSRGVALPLAAGTHPTVVSASGAAPAAAMESASAWDTLRDYFLLGAHHLLEGYDHLAFLLALVLPLRLALFPVARRSSRAAAGRADPGGRQVWWALLRTVTAFTVGHSMTLALVAFGWMQGSARWVEPAIALSIAITAALNLRPVAWVRSDVLALLFGLVHGMGFAGLLQEAAAPGSLLPWALAGFNLGVEGGQLLAVFAWLALVQTVVARPWYPSVVVRGGSVLLILIAAWWLWQRVQ